MACRLCIKRRQSSFFNVFYFYFTMASSLYHVTYRVDSTTTGRNLNLSYGSESEAKEALYRQGAVPRNKDIIILEVRRV